jgi:hypothetical protein
MVRARPAGNNAFRREESVFMPSRTAIRRMAEVITVALFAGWTAASLRAESAYMLLEIVRRADDQVLWAQPVLAGDSVALDYRHSSDHTPVHDVFQVTAEGAFVLVEERFDWYGSGLEFHPSADITFSGSQTVVHLHRPFPQIPLRVGEVAQHVLTVHQTRVPLLSIAKGRESICIRISRQPAEHR